VVPLGFSGGQAALPLIVETAARMLTGAAHRRLDPAVNQGRAAVVDGLASSSTRWENLDLPETVEVARAESPLVASLVPNYGSRSDRDLLNLATWPRQADRTASMRVWAG
jgi:hypothetical protein